MEDWKKCEVQDAELVGMGENLKVSGEGPVHTLTGRANHQDSQGHIYIEGGS
jgi:hypothetical protein